LKAQAVLVTPQVHLRELVVNGNTFVLNGAGLAPIPAGVIGIHLKPEANPGVNIDRVEIGENVFGFTSPPPTPGPLIAINHRSPRPGFGVGSIAVRGNRLLGGSTLEGVPPLANGRLIAQFLRVGVPGNAIAVAELDVTGNTAPPGTIGGKWFASPPDGATIQQSHFAGNSPGPGPG
jgi:hypothetical protein